MKPHAAGLRRMQTQHQPWPVGRLAAARSRRPGRGLRPLLIAERHAIDGTSRRTWPNSRCRRSTGQCRLRLSTSSSGSLKLAPLIHQHWSMPRSRPPRRAGLKQASAVRPSSCSAERRRCVPQSGQHAAAARREGAARRQAFGSGTVPAMAAQPAARAVEGRQRVQQSCGVGMAGGRRTGPADAPLSTMRPAYMTATRSQFSATTPRSWLISTSAMPVVPADAGAAAQDLRLDGGVERRRRLVGDQQLRLAGQRHGDQIALVHAAGKLMRKVAQPPFRVGMPTSRAGGSLRRGSPARTGPPRHQGSGSAGRLAELPADAVHGIEAADGSWKIMAIFGRAPW